jgi:5'(3')-deoxyribonucleotidase
MAKKKWYPAWQRASIKIDKPICYVDMDGVTCNFDKAKAEYVAAGGKANGVYKEDGFFAKLEPIEGAIEAIKKLSESYEVYFASTAPWSSPYAFKDKRIWVEENMPAEFKKKLILTHNKGLLKGDYIIDDRVANGILDFEGEHVHFGEEGFENWDKVLEYLL